MTGARSGFAAWHRRDRLFFLIFVAAAWVTVGFGFGPSIVSRFRGTADYPAPASLEIHVWSFFAWLTILTAQVELVRLRRQGLHRLLGLSLVVLIPVMAVSGLTAELHSQRFYAPKDPENARFYIVPLLDIILFVVAATLAFVRRGDPAAHKRLILLATAVILSAGFGRWWGPAIEGVVGDGYWGVLLSTWLGTLLLIGAAALYDLATRGRVHPVLAWGGAGYALAFAAASALYFTDFWPVLVRRVLGLGLATVG